MENTPLVRVMNLIGPPTKNKIKVIASTTICKVRFLVWLWVYPTSPYTKPIIEKIAALQSEVLKTV